MSAVGFNLAESFSYENSRPDSAFAVGQLRKARRGFGWSENADVFDRRDPLVIARNLICDQFFDPIALCPTLRFWAGQWWRRVSGCYRPVEEAALHAEIYAYLDRAKRLAFDKASEEYYETPFQPTIVDKRGVLDALKATLHLSEDRTPPFWIDAPDTADAPDAADPPDKPDRYYLGVLKKRSEAWALPVLRDVLPVRNGLLDLAVRNVVHDHTPLLFSTYAADFDYDPDAPEPERWMQFLDELWSDKPENIAVLQEWFGYCLTADTSQQKMLFLIGPKRSGKGTAARVLSSLLGRENVAGATTASLASNFGLQGLIGKPLAVVSDARFHGAGVATAIERLLCISGEDALQIDRKYLTPMSMRLPTRLMFLSNELPRLPDASGAIASRFLVLTMTRSFYDQEDPDLTEKLVKELPGILLWGIQGFKRLRRQGRFAEPEESVRAREEMEELGSPVRTFVEECCQVGLDERVETGELYAVFCAWCERQGQKAETQALFGRNLKTAFPNIIKRHNRAAGCRFYEGIGLCGSGH